MSSSSDYPDSYYVKTRNDFAFPQALVGDVHIETCVIGGGLAGISTALGLVERGRPALLLEANKVGWGASGRNGGFVGSGYALGVEVLIKKVGLENAQKMHGLSQSALRLIRSRIEEFDIDCGPTVDGSLDACMWENNTELSDYAAFMNDKFSEDYEFWDRAKVRAHYKTDAYYGGVLDKQGYHLHPLNLTLGLADAFVKKGGQLFENTAAKKITKQGGKIIIEGDKGRVIADNLVLACSGYIKNLMPKISRATLPITTYVLVTEPLGDRMAEMTDLPYSVSDDRISCDYYRPLPDGSSRILWGGRITAFPTKPSNVAKIMRQNMLRIFPQFEDVKIDSAWSGIMGYAAHKMPLIGEVDDNIWVNSCYGGHGMASTTVGGEVIADAITGANNDYELFKPFGLNFTGGKLGPIAAQAYYLASYLKDEWHIKRGH